MLTLVDMFKIRKAADLTAAVAGAGDTSAGLQEQVLPLIQSHKCIMLAMRLLALSEVESCCSGVYLGLSFS